jgi:hypothetical protein
VLVSHAVVARLVQRTSAAIFHFWFIVGSLLFRGFWIGLLSIRLCTGRFLLV